MPEQDSDAALTSMRDEAHELLTEAHYHHAGLLFERYGFLIDDREVSAHAFAMAGIAFALAGERHSAVTAVFVAKTQADTRVERRELEDLRVTVRNIAEQQARDNTT